MFFYFVKKRFTSILSIIVVTLFSFQGTIFEILISLSAHCAAINLLRLPPALHSPMCLHVTLASPTIAPRFHNGTLMYVSAFVNKRSNLHYSSFNVHAARQRVHALHRDSYIILPQSLAFVNTFFKLFSLFSPLSMLPSILCLSSLFYTIYSAKADSSRCPLSYLPFIL